MKNLTEKTWAVKDQAMSNNLFLTGCVFLLLSIVHQQVNAPHLIEGKYLMEMFLRLALEMN